MCEIGLICDQKPPRVFHMYRCEHLDQLSFEVFLLPFGGKLAGDKRWIMLAELVPWDALEDYYVSQFCCSRASAALVVSQLHHRIGISGLGNKALHGRAALWADQIPPAARANHWPGWGCPGFVDRSIGVTP